MPHRSADKPASTFSIRGGCVHTMEKPKPLSAVRVSFLVIVNGVRPFWFCEFVCWSLLAPGCSLDFNVDLRRSSPLCGVGGGTGVVDASTGGSSSKNRKNKFSSASLWWMAFFESVNGVVVPRPSSLLSASSTLDWEFSHMATSGVLTVKHDFGCNLNDPLISLDDDTDFTGTEIHPKNSLRLMIKSKKEKKFLLEMANLSLGTQIK